MSTLEWMAQGTTLFLSTLDRVDDDRLAGPTALPGWTGRHLVAHVHFNALALCRLTDWAATGAENRMYASAEQRGQEIEDGATRSAGELRALVRSSADELARRLAALSPEARHHEVVTAQGRTVPATEIPWMRTREVFIHAVDLGTGTSFDDFPDDLVAALVTDVVRKRVGAGEGPGLAAWLTGRSDSAPVLATWL